MRIIRQDLSFIKGAVRLNEPMSCHTAFKIGGPADAWVSPADEDDLIGVLRYAEEKNIDIFIIGGGSKLLVSDNGFRGIVISLEAPAFSDLAVGRYAANGENVNGDTVYAGCGIKTRELIKLAAENGLGGLEFLSGIPGTLGGALMMNAGWPAKAIGDFTEEVDAFKDLKKIKLVKGDLRFSYRGSNLEGLVLISARLRLEKKARDKVDIELNKNFEKKRKTQDLGFPSVGSVFLNPSGNASAWELIEKSGFKGRSIGGAAVSVKHANFIINRGGAKAADVKRLIDEIQKKVFIDSEIMLKLEVKLIGEF